MCNVHSYFFSLHQPFWYRLMDGSVNLLLTLMLLFLTHMTLSLMEHCAFSCTFIQSKLQGGTKIRNASRFFRLFSSKLEKRRNTENIWSLSSSKKTKAQHRSIITVMLMTPPLFTNCSAVIKQSCFVWETDPNLIFYSLPKHFNMKVQKSHLIEGCWLNVNAL